VGSTGIRYNFPFHSAAPGDFFPKPAPGVAHVSRRTSDGRRVLILTNPARAQTAA